MAMNPVAAKASVDKIIHKARVHFYKPIQIAEILYRDRVQNDIDLADLETYRIESKKWRDVICDRFIGRRSNSSSKYQDDVFNENAIPPAVLVSLGNVNRIGNGIVEKYIYDAFGKRLSMMAAALVYLEEKGSTHFDLHEFLQLFWQKPGLKRSIDKIYEIVVYALFSTLVEAFGVSIRVSMNPEKYRLLDEFSDFAKMVVNLTPENTSFQVGARIHRVGVTNAADRGLDMFANFGLAIQIKHLSLTEELAEGIVQTVTADRIVIVCKDNEKNLIVSLLNQIGWKSRIQSIITEQKLIEWYQKALRGKFSSELANTVVRRLANEINAEFPSMSGPDFEEFRVTRGYDGLPEDVLWANC